MDTNTGKFHSVPELEKQLDEATFKEVMSGKSERYKLFTLGEVIMLKGELFLLQSINDDCLFLVPKVKADALRAK